MRNIIRFFNQNKKQIIRVILLILFVFIILQLLNNMTKEKNKNLNAISEDKSIDYGKDYSIISESYKDESIYKRETNILNQFANYCNEKNYEQAYDLLTDNCKEALYPNIDTFIQGYCNENFENKKTCKFQAWNEQTYLVEIRRDAMSTGVYSENNYLQDYYTVEGDKLNINSFVKRENVNKEKTSENITIKIDSIDYFIDYTQLNITTINMNKERILLDTQENERTILLTDGNGLKLSSNVNEIAKQSLVIESGGVRKNTLRFEEGYKTDIKLRNLELSGILKENQGLIDKIEINI